MTAQGYVAWRKGQAGAEPRLGLGLHLLVQQAGERISSKVAHYFFFSRPSLFPCAGVEPPIPVAHLEL